VRYYARATTGLIANNEWLTRAFDWHTIDLRLRTFREEDGLFAQDTATLYGSDQTCP